MTKIIETHKLCYNKETLERVHAVLDQYVNCDLADLLIKEIQEAGILFRERFNDEPRIG